jgi:hypothetical protein
MPKKFLIFICFSTTLLHGMEKETVSLVKNKKTSLCLVYRGTKINLIKGSWEDAIDTIELTVVGKNQQRTLHMECDFDRLPYLCIGDAYEADNNDINIYKRKKEDESYSDDDTYNPYYPINQQRWKHSPETKKTKNCIIKIEEPRITLTPLPKNLQGILTYCTQRKIRNRNGSYHYYFTDDKAIQEASNDLFICYTIALNTGLEYFKKHEEQHKNITFPTLSADVGFPRDQAPSIAIQAIFNFIQKTSNKYENIYFFVKKRSEFALYKKLLMEYYKPIKVIYLLYWMHKNAEQNFAILDKDAIDQIVRLMYNS